MWSRNIIRKEALWGGWAVNQTKKLRKWVCLHYSMRYIHTHLNSWWSILQSAMAIFRSVLLSGFIFPCSPPHWQCLWIMHWVRLSSHGRQSTLVNLSANMDYVCSVHVWCMSMDIYQPKLNSSLCFTLPCCIPLNLLSQCPVCSCS